METINQESNNIKPNWFLKIKKVPARYWLIGEILFIDVFFLLFSFMGRDPGFLLMFFGLVTFPIAGLILEHRWANIYLWFIILGLVCFEYLFSIFSLLSSSFSEAVLTIVFMLTITITMIVLNIKSFPSKK